MGANDSTTWGQLGPDLTSLGATFTATSANSVGVNGSLAGGAGSVVSVVCPSAPSCSWIPSGSGFAAGDSLVATSNFDGGATGPLSLGFASAFGAGLWIQVDVPGTFTAQIQSFNGITPTGNFTVASNGAGDPVFIGVLDTVADITSITVGLSACGGIGCNTNDFAVDTLFMKEASVATPEPSSILLFGGGLAGLVGWRRKRLVKMSSLTTIIAGGIVAGLVVPAFGQLNVTGPLTQISDAKGVATLHASAPVHGGSIATLVTNPLPIGLYSVLGYDGITYQGEIVGRSPFARGARTTTVNVILIPVIVKTNGTGGPFTSDPTAADNGCLGSGHTALSLTQGSPMLNAPPSPFTMNGVTVGGLQFGDAHLRAEFWNLISPAGNAFHLALPYTTAATMTLDATGQTSFNASTLTYPAGCGTNAGTTNNGGKLSYLNINYLDNILQGYITTLSLTPNQFPLFVIYRTVIADGAANTVNNCCILGYHNAAVGTATGNPGQTYGIAEFDTSDVFTDVADTSVMAHEVAEWINDPGVSNPTPVYSSGQTFPCAQGGQNNLEVGDPLSGIGVNHVVTMNGFTYHMQEEAYFSWFFSPDHAGSLGAGTCAGLGSGCMSTNGTFKGPARACPTGGTFPN